MTKIDNAIPDSIRAEIYTRLHNAEAEHKITILMAIESGSRAWGFPSPDSDYDVRFIYAHQYDWYLSCDLQDKRDVVEYDIVDEIDINGWDIRKALLLLNNSNPGIIEWLNSNIIYWNERKFKEKMLALVPQVYSPKKGVMHYRSMAHMNYRDELRGAVVPLKKYFYVLRALLSATWISKNSVPPPIEFQQLLPLIEGTTVHEKALDLLERKRHTPELGRERAIQELNEFIESELQKAAVYEEGPREKERGVASCLNDFYREVIRDTF